MKIIRFLIVAVAVLLPGCTGLPEYAQPRLTQNHYDLFNERVITSRKLTRLDFQSPSFPESLQKYSSKLNAHTALSIRPANHSKYTIGSFVLDGQITYYGRVEHLQFEAVMIPDHSWWRPQLAKEKHAHVLQHEQIHFALMEISARKLTNKVYQESVGFTGINSTALKVKKDLQTKISTFLKKHNVEAMKQHEYFDYDTSLTFNPSLQNWWYGKVLKELEEMEEKGSTFPKLHHH